MDNIRLSIHQWAEEDRPREKMRMKGVGALSDAELLAMLIGSGTKEESAVQLMRRLLSDCDHNLNELSKWGYERYAAYKGIGTAKASTIMAALELGKRRAGQAVPEREKIRCSADIYRIFRPLMCDLTTEEGWLLLLNQAHRVIDKLRISTGGIDGTYMDVRSILREALLQRATSIVVVHNHPSNNPVPSAADRQLTATLKRGAETMNIRLIDHLIVCEDGYYSFADEGALI
ncbi:MAG: DNA repair protein RadC [Prevotellaceae bacterium]|jgi:DNA repair protein RadC|nr:DNA repair protein RadC [Prevotellaceae bacterium]